MTEYKEQTLYELMVRLVMKHNVSMSRQAIAKHIAVLEEAGIIRSQRHGRYRVLKFSNVPLKKVMERWLK